MVELATTLQTKDYLQQRLALNKSDIINLAAGKIGAFSVRNFYEPMLAKKACQAFLNKYNYYENAQAIGRVGMAFYETAHNKQKVADYYQLSQQHINEIRDAFHPFLSPLDLLRLKLQECWPQGANIEKIDHEQMFVGLVRVIEPGVDVMPHQDDLRFDASWSQSTKALKAQFAANIYLDLPDEGGELVMWNQQYEQTAYDQLRKSNDYGVNKKSLPKPACLYKPSRGELVIFNCRRLHAVRSVSSRPRLSISCFIGYRGKDQPLSYWS